MNRFNQILVAVLAIQVVIAGGFYFGSSSPTAEQVQMALIEGDTNQIDHITISEGNEELVTLQKIDGQWKLNDYFLMPAVQSKVSNILSTLKSTNTSWPVATTKSSQERFEVADDHYQKKIVLSHDDKTLQTLYLGTSPGFRQIHIRRAGEDEIYAVKLNSFDFPVQNTAWLDKTLLQPKADITRLSGADFELLKQGTDWQAEAGKGEPVVEEIDKITQALAGLSIQSVVEKAPTKADYTLTLDAGGKPLHYTFFNQDESYLVQRDDYSQVFKISKSDYEKLTGHTASQLVMQSSPDEQSQNTTTAGGSSSHSNQSTTDTQKEELSQKNS